MPIEGFKKLSGQLERMSKAASGKALRSAAFSATLPAKRAAEAAAPQGEPPYTYAGHAPVDPYPRKTHKGKLVAPGYTSRNIVRKSRLSRDKARVTVAIGVEAQGWAAVVFGELGSSVQPARPWLEPSFRRSIAPMNNQFWRRLKQLIDKAAR